MSGSIWKVSAVPALLGAKLSGVNASLVRRVYHPLLGNRRPATLTGYEAAISTESVGWMSKLPIEAIICAILRFEFTMVAPLTWVPVDDLERIPRFGGIVKRS